MSVFLREYRRPDDSPSGRLQDLTFAAKDNFTVAGAPCTFGLNPPLIQTAPLDAGLVAHCKKAGAAFLGSTNLDEAALDIKGQNASYGPVTNPRFPEKLTLGSSCGSAAAVADEAVDFALGSDFGGSIRAPAAACAVIGFKPTSKFFTREGFISWSDTLDAPGIIARSVETLALVLDQRLEANMGNVRFLVPDVPELHPAWQQKFNEITDALPAVVRISREVFFEAFNSRKEMAILAIAETAAKWPGLRRLPIVQAAEAAASMMMRAQIIEKAEKLKLRLREFLSEGTFLLTPTLLFPVPDRENAGALAQTPPIHLYLPAANIADLCAISLPFSEKATFSLQVIGVDEAGTLKAAYFLEQRMKQMPRVADECL